MPSSTSGNRSSTPFTGKRARCAFPAPRQLLARLYETLGSSKASSGAPLGIGDRAGIGPVRGAGTLAARAPARRRLLDSDAGKKAVRAASRSRGTVPAAEAARSGISTLRALKAAVRKLSPRSGWFLVRRYGLDGSEPATCGRSRKCSGYRPNACARSRGSPSTSSAAPNSSRGPRRCGRRADGSDRASLDADVRPGGLPSVPSPDQRTFATRTYSPFGAFRESRRTSGRAPRPPAGST